MLSLEPGSLPRLYQKSLSFSDQPIEVGKNIMNANRTASLVRKATISDLSRIAEIFNCPPYFYPIFRSDEYYFDELCVPSLMQKYVAGLDSLCVYDGAAKGFIKIEGTYIAGLFMAPVLQNASVGSQLPDYAIADYLRAPEKNEKANTLSRETWVYRNQGEKNRKTEPPGALYS